MGTGSCRSWYRVHTSCHCSEPPVTSSACSSPPSSFQSLSRHNHRAEHIWPEVDQCVNYPIKLLLYLENGEEIDMADEVSKFCVSWVTISVMSSAVHTFIEAWNSHCIPGPSGRVPNVLAAQTNRVVHLSSSSIPLSHEILQIREVARGSRSYIHPEASSGRDPIQNHVQLSQLRKRDFSEVFPDMTIVFQDILHGNGLLFYSAMKLFFHLTKQLAMLLYFFCSMHLLYIDGISDV